MFLFCSDGTSRCTVGLLRSHFCQQRRGTHIRCSSGLLKVFFLFPQLQGIKFHKPNLIYLSMPNPHPSSWSVRHRIYTLALGCLIPLDAIVFSLRGRTTNSLLYSEQHCRNLCHMWFKISQMTKKSSVKGASVRRGFKYLVQSLRYFPRTFECFVPDGKCSRIPLCLSSLCSTERWHFLATLFTNK